MKEKNLGTKKAIELIKQNTYEKKNKKNTIPGARLTTKEKRVIKEKPIQRMEKFGARTKTIYRNPIMKILQEPELESIIYITGIGVKL